MQQNASVCAFSPGGASWVILNSIEQRIKAKVERVGAPLKEWGISINYGIKTGFNDAFIVDEEKRNAILSNCRTDDERKRTVDLIRPILRGRDIQRYGYEWSGLYVILAYYGSHKVLKDQYPAIYSHLLPHESALKERGQCRYTSSGKPNLSANAPYPGQHHWLELDNNPTRDKLEDFSKPKLMWAETMRIRKDNDERFPRFAYTEQHFFTDKTCFVALGEDLKFLLAMLNSTLCRYQLSQTVAILDNGGYLMQKIYLEQIRVCKVESAVRSEMISHVTSLLGSMTAERRGFIEDQLDLMVSSAFGLTDKEHKYLCTHTSQPLQRG